jgi:hypothetical protein
MSGGWRLDWLGLGLGQGAGPEGSQPAATNQFDVEQADLVDFFPYQQVNPGPCVRRS